MIVTDKLSTESLHAFIDEQLTDEQYAKVESQLDQIPEKVIEIQQCQIINERLRDVFDPIVQEEIPLELVELGFGELAGHQQYPESAIDDPDISEHELSEQQYADDSENNIEINDELTSPGYASMQSMPDLDGIDTDGGANVAPDVEDANAFDATSALQHSAIPAEQKLENRPRKARRLFSQSDDLSPQTSPQDMEEILKSIDSLSLDSTLPEAEAAEDFISVESEQVVSSAKDNFSDQDLEAAAYHLLQDEYIAASLSGAELGGSEPDSELDNDIDSQLLSADQAPSSTLQQDSAIAQSASLDYDVQQESVAEVEEVTQVAMAEQAPLNNGEDLPELEVLLEQQAALKQQYIKQLADADQQNRQAGAETHFTPRTHTGVERQHASIGEINSEETYSVNNEHSDTAHPAPDDLVAEFFTLRKNEMDFEVNEVIKHFEIVSGNMPQPGISGVVDSSPVLKFKAKMGNALDVFKNKLNVVQEGLSDKKQKLSTVFKKMTTKRTPEPMPLQDVVFLDDNGQPTILQEFDSQEPIAQKTVVVDEAIIEQTNVQVPEVQVQSLVDAGIPDLTEPDTKPQKTRTKKTKAASGNATKSKVTKIKAPKSKARKTKQAEIEVTQTADELPLPEPLIQEAAAAESASPADVEPVVSTVQESAGGKQLHSPRANFVANLIKFEAEFSDQPLYKRALEKARIMALYYGRLSWDFLQKQRVIVFTRLAKYSDMLAKYLESMSPENRMVAGGAVLLVVGLVVGGSFVALISQPSIVINDDMDNLAVDAHVLYNQQQQNLSDNVRTINSESMKWLPEEMSRTVSMIAGTQVDGFQQQNAILIPTTEGYATLHTFKNASDQILTLLISADQQNARDSQVTCRVLKTVDGLCNWTRHNIHYVTVANLSSSRVRDFSQKLLDKL